MSAVVNTTPVSSNALRQRVDEFIGLFFYGTMLKNAREGRMTDSKYGFGGRGEQAFGAQLDLELADRIGRASHNRLGEAVYRELSRGQRPGASPGKAGTAPGAAGLGELGRLAAGAADRYAADARPSTIDLRH